MLVEYFRYKGLKIAIVLLFRWLCDYTTMWVQWGFGDWIKIM